MLLESLNAQRVLSGHDVWKGIQPVLRALLPLVIPAFAAFLFYCMSARKFKAIVRAKIALALKAVGKTLLGFAVVWLAPLLIPALSVYGLYRLGGWSIRFVQNGFRVPVDEA